MRTKANHAIFQLQHKVSKYFREYLESVDFVEIHSPKIIATASEGGANVFKLGYFGKDAFLAQSPQLYKQMALMGDLHRCGFIRLFEQPVFPENFFMVKQRDDRHWNGTVVCQRRWVAK